MSATPQYAATPQSPSVVISTANTNLDGTGTLGTLLTPGASGSRVDRIRVNATGATTAGMIRFFLGTSLIYELPVLAITPSATQPAWAADVDFEKGLALQPSSVLKVGTHNAETFAVSVTSGGNF